MTAYLCISVPYSLGERSPNRTEVDAIQASGLADQLGAPWVEVTPDFAAYPDPLIAVNRALAETIGAHPNHIPLIFAGDCLSALGAVKGLEARRPAVLWYDAHGDFNTPETSPSGFLGGMPLAMLVGRGDMTYVDGVGLTPVEERDVIITDARNLDPLEADALRESQVTHLAHLSDLLTAPLPPKPLYVHVDLDVIDPADMPALSHPEPGGPSLAQTAATLERVRRDAQVAGVLFSLFDGKKDGADQALQALLLLVRSIV